MAIDNHYVLGAPLCETFVDKTTGLPLAGGTISFYKDNARLTAKSVYELSGSPPNYTFTPLPNPMTLSAVGTPMNGSNDNVAIYYYPYDADPDSDTFEDIELYYVVVKDSDGVEQFVREAWPADTFSGGEDGAVNALPPQNQISNPQFTRTFLNETTADGSTDSEPMVYTVSGSPLEFEFAPNWTFEINGSGTVTVQRIVIAGVTHAPTSPPYSVNVTVGAGITSCKLRQRFNSNSGLWASTADNDIFLSSLMVIKNNIGSSAGIQMVYAPSSGAETIIFDQVITSLEYVQYTDGSETAIVESTDSGAGPDGYVDIYISFPTPCDVEVSSIQVIPSFNADAAAIVAFDETSANRDQALMGDYYIPRLEAKPIKSLLTGWDFPLNSNGYDFTVTGTPGYTWDDTIMGRATGNVTVSRNSVTNGMTAVQTASNNDAFYVMQFLTGDQAKKILGTRLSVNVNAYTSVGSSGTITMRVYLYRGAAAATTDIAFGTVAITGLFTLTDAVNWSLIPRSGLDTAMATLNEITAANGINDGNDYSFTGWQITDSAEIADTDKFAIVATFHNDIASTVNVTSISVVPGDIPTRPLFEPVTYGQMQVATIEITSAQIKTLYSAPLEVLPAPGEGKALFFMFGSLGLNYNSVQYTGGSGNGPYLYTNSVTAGGDYRVSEYVFNVIMTGASSRQGYMGKIDQPTFASSIDFTDQPLYLSVDTSNYATGNSTATLTIWYTIINT